MSNRVDIAKKMVEIRELLIRYNGMPSQNVDRAAYSNIRYYINRYADFPEIKSLIEEFSLKTSNGLSREQNFELRFKEIKTILETHKRIPITSTNMEEFQAVNFFFRHYKNNPEVERLKWIYADSDCFPLNNNELRKRNPLSFNKMFRDKRYALPISCDYAIQVFKMYGVLPAEKTPPMEMINRDLPSFKYAELPYKYGYEHIDRLITELIKLGCNDPLITENKHI